jgi:hypothetical protein
MAAEKVVAIVQRIAQENPPVEVIEISNPLEAQRCRRAQYSGLPTRISLNGATVRGVVRSVKEETGARWKVTIIPKAEKIFVLPRHRPSYTA